MATVSAVAMLPAKMRGETLHVAGHEVEIQLTTVSQNTFRLTLLPIQDAKVGAVITDGSLVRTHWGAPSAALRGNMVEHVVKCGALSIRINTTPLTFTISSAKDEVLQQLTIDAQKGSVSFLSGDSPLLGLGEGGPQFDRRGSIDEMRSGQGGYKLATHGGRVPIPWFISTSGWAMFIHHPFGAFDFSTPEARFQPSAPETALPLDLFFVGSFDPAVIMAEYALLTGRAELPPLWSFGYQQSHRT